jgi:hypothetical protein
MPPTPQKQGRSIVPEPIRAGSASVRGPNTRTRVNFKTNNSGMSNRISQRSRKSPKASKKSGKKVYKETKRRRKRTKLSAKKTLRGPVGTVTVYYPSDNGLTSCKVWDVSTQTYKLSGNMQSAVNKSTNILYKILTKEQCFAIQKTGEGVSETSYEADNWKGVFDPAPMGVSVNSGAQTGHAKNFVKETEQFVYKTCLIKVFVSNASFTPARVWLDLYKCKQTAVDGDVTIDTTNAYNNQPFLQGPGAHSAKGPQDLFDNQFFDELKVKGRQYWTHKGRKELYIVPGQELQVNYVLKDLVYDGKKVATWEDSSATADVIKGVTHNILVNCIGLLGKDSNTPYAGARTTSNVTTRVEMEIKGYRANIFMREGKQYIIDTPFPPVDTTGFVEIVCPTLTAYD